MASNHRSRCPVRFRSMARWLCACGVAAACGTAAAQAVDLSLEQTASITSRGVQPAASASTLTLLPEDISKLRLMPGLVLQMSVFGAPEMTQTLTVDDTGEVAVPLVGLVHVQGDTLRQAEMKIAGVLAEKQMINDPEVSLQLMAYTPRSVVVAGEVQQPGRIQLLAPRPLLDVLASAGGVTTAAGGDIEVRHPVAGAPDEVRHIPYASGKEPTAAQATLVYPGDSIFVRRAGVIYVLGAVTRPGGYLMVNAGKLSLTQAIAAAYGTTPVASPGRTIVIRRQEDKLVRLQLDLNKEQRGEATPLALQDGDMVYVPTSKIKSALINTSAVLSSAASAAIYAGFSQAN
jgi:polysaccharide biosynthesis/export protein